MRGNPFSRRCWNERERSLATVRRSTTTRCVTERVAYAATELRAARELSAFQRSLAARGARRRSRGHRGGGASPIWSGARALRLESMPSSSASTTPRSSAPSRPQLRAMLRAAEPRVARARDRPCGDRSARPQRPPARRDARAGARVGARVRREGGRAARRAHPPPRRARPRVVHPRRWASSATSASSIPEEYGGHEHGQPRDDPHHRGAVARVARRARAR